MTIELAGSVPAGSDYTISTEYYDEGGNLVDTITEPLVKIGADGHGNININTDENKDNINININMMRMVNW